MARKPVEPPKPQKHWGFFLDGSFTDEGNHHRKLTDLVRSLVRARQAAEISPKRTAANVPAEFFQAFPHLDQWSTIEDPDFWPSAAASTSAEAIVKYATRGSNLSQTAQSIIPWSESQANHD